MNTLVLLPGLDGTGSLFAPLLQELPKWIEPRVVAYPYARCLGYADLEALVKAALPVDRPYVLLGESFSGPIAIRIAAAQPPGLIGVILVCSFARNPYPLFAWAQGVARRVSPRLLPATLRATLALGSGSGGPLRTAMEHAVTSVAPEVLAHRAATVLGMDDTALLKRLVVPTLYLRAARDYVVPSRAGDWIRDHLPQLELEEIDGPHMLLQANAREAARVIGLWVQALSPQLGAHGIDS
jgi:pimeloyl-[acyl-carrier protein] methyl ester esterase